jgi:hypothetical protein
VQTVVTCHQALFYKVIGKAAQEGLCLNTFLGFAAPPTGSRGGGRGLAGVRLLGGDKIPLVITPPAALGGWGVAPGENVGGAAKPLDVF